MNRFPFVRCLLLAVPCLCLCLFAPLTQAASTLIVLGDSLSAGYGIRQEAAWPNLLAKRLQDMKLDYNVVNASISGETTSGGLARLNVLLEKHAPRIVIIALGSNDGLRGLPVPTIRSNLLAMIDAAQKKRVRVLLIGQRLPPNYGIYADQFHRIYGEVAKKRKTAFVEFLLDGVASNDSLFQADKLHPTAAAQPLLLDNVWQGLAPLLK